MKKVAMFVGILILVALLVPAFNITDNAKAGPTITVSPGSGIVGTKVTITWSGGGNSNTIYFYDYSGNSNTVSSGLGSSGIIIYVIPPSTGGRGYFKLWDGTLEATFNFTVLPSITLSPSSGIVNGYFDVIGNGFSSRSSAITIQWDGGYLNMASSNKTGSFTQSETVPNSGYGSHIVNASDENLYNVVNYAIANFFVLPNIEVSPNTGVVGRNFTAFFTGYTANSPITLTWNTTNLNEVIASGYTDNSGASILNAVVPYSPNGSAYLIGEDSQGVSNITTFTVIPQISINVSASFQGNIVSVIGRGFNGSHSVSIGWDNHALILGNTFTNSTGCFSFHFAIPPSSNGYHIITAYGKNITDASTEVFVQSHLSISPYFSSPGNTVKINATGFLGGTANLILDPGMPSQKTVITNFALNSTGNSNYTSEPSFTVPNNEQSGVHVVEAVENNQNIIAVSYLYVGPVILLSQYKGYVGENITVKGYGFSPNSLINLYFIGPSKFNMGSVFADSKGNFNRTITIPYAFYGNHEIVAVSSSIAYVNFTVVPHLVLSSKEGFVGSIIHVTGTGFKPYNSVHIYWDNMSLFYNNITDTSGSLNLTFTIPSESYGNYTISLVNNSNNLVSNYVNFFVMPSIKISNSYLYTSEEVSVLAQGFAANSVVTLTWDYASLNYWNTTYSNGSAIISFNVPSASTGVHILNAYDQAMDFATPIKVIVMNPSVPILLSPYNNSYINNTEPIFEWTNVKYAYNYTLQYSINPSFSNAVTITNIKEPSYQLDVNLSNGIYYWRVKALDVAGYGNYSITYSFKIDTVPPVSSLIPLPRWENTLRFNIYYTAYDSGSGIKSVSLYYNYNGGNFEKYKTIYSNTTPNVFSFVAPYGSGNYSFYTIALDNAGNYQLAPINKGNYTYTTVVTEPPVSTIMPLPKYENRNTFDIYYNVSGTAPVRGVYLYYSNNSLSWNIYSNSIFSTSPIVFTAPSSGTYYFYTRAVDYAGNVQTANLTKSYTIVDLYAPVTSIGISGNITSTGWYHGAVKIYLNSTDNISGVRSTFYSINGLPWNLYNGTFIIYTSGVYYIRYYSINFAGNSEAVKNTSIRIETTPPSVLSFTPSYNNIESNSVNITTAVYDHSGISEVFIKLDNGIWIKMNYIAYNSTSGIAYYVWHTDTGDNGIHTIQIKIVDNAGFAEISQFTVNIENTSNLPVVFMIILIIIIAVIVITIYSIRKKTLGNDIPNNAQNNNQMMGDNNTNNQPQIGGKGDNK
ncbi:MAG: OmpL47-type beta-barrel domain-containing protein [Thermoplasmata archaeon]